MSTTTTNATAVRIKANYGYFSGTYNAPKNGYLQGPEQYDGHTGRKWTAPLEFDSVKAAYDYLTNSDAYYQDAMFCEYDGDGQFSVGGTYVTSHGQHSRPVYTIVSAKSGRCNKSIIAECDRIAAPGYTTHTNQNGIPYYSRPDDEHGTIYSFSVDFEDIWTQDDQDLYGA